MDHALKRRERRISVKGVISFFEKPFGKLVLALLTATLVTVFIEPARERILGLLKWRVPFGVVLVGVAIASTAFFIYRDRMNQRLAESEKALERSERKRASVRNKLLAARKPMRRRPLSFGR